MNLSSIKHPMYLLYLLFYITELLCATVYIMSSSIHTHTKNPCILITHRFILSFFFFSFTAMATTICLRTLISKSAQWVVIRLWDYPIRTEKSNRPEPNHRKIHAQTDCYLFNVCVCVRKCVYICVCVCKSV